jgi:hypothetical protein
MIEIESTTDGDCFELNSDDSCTVPWYVTIMIKYILYNEGRKQDISYTIYENNDHYENDAYEIDGCGQVITRLEFVSDPKDPDRRFADYSSEFILKTDDGFEIHIGYRNSLRETAYELIRGNSIKKLCPHFVDCSGPSVSG